MNVRPTLVLVHSPLLGPATWEAVHRLLNEASWRVIVPRLLNDAPAGGLYWRRHCENVRAALDAANINGPLVLAGHSGAGPVVPALAEASGRSCAAYVFVDSDLPRADRSRFDRFDRAADVEALRARAVHDMLPPWNEWFGEEVMAALVPDPVARQKVLAEALPTPLTLYDEILPVPSNWPDAPCGYLQLSGAYDKQARQAESQGWPTERLASNHLGMVTQPAAVTSCLNLLLSRLI